MVRIASRPLPATPNLAAGQAYARGAVRSHALLASWVAGMFFLASIALSLYLLQVSSVANAGYELARLEVERKEWQARNGQLELELAKRHSLVWTEAQAAQRGMVRVDKPTYIVVDGYIPPTCPSGKAGCSSPVLRAPDPSSQAVSTPSGPRRLESLGEWLASLLGR
jgi:hypothetical protein